MANWRSRIVGSAEVDPKTLVENPLNWRVHPPNQQAALESALDAVGWIQQVLVNRTTGHMIDGHARVHLALRRGEPAVPVVYVELTEVEERAALASLDPLSAMAVTDPEALFSVVDGLTTGNATFDEYLASQRQVASSTRVKGVSEGSRAKSAPHTVVKVVLPVVDLVLFEDALTATGQVNRADALAVVCRSYLNERQREAGQHDAAEKGVAAPVAAQKAASAPSAARDARRARVGLGPSV